MSDQRGIVHSAGQTPYRRGDIRLMVGFCTLYEEGHTVLLTLDQGDQSEVEIALLPAEARALAAKLVEAADSMDKPTG
ncbi:MAG TPA: hypothetical protein VFB89_06265 [Gemmatimonadales bacterium]|nr:hypothetical protein [Gemmatimonadales bacterium]